MVTERDDVKSALAQLLVADNERSRVAAHAELQKVIAARRWSLDLEEELLGRIIGLARKLTELESAAPEKKPDQPASQYKHNPLEQSCQHWTMCHPGFLRPIERVIAKRFHDTNDAFILALLSARPPQPLGTVVATDHCKDGGSSVGSTGSVSAKDYAKEAANVCLLLPWLKPLADGLGKQVSKIGRPAADRVLGAAMNEAGRNLLGGISPGVLTVLTKDWPRGD